MFFIGLMQALAIMPGVSRAGVVITAALLVGFTRKDSIRISFLLSIPAILWHQPTKLYSFECR